MVKIHQLPQDIIAKIAAGEVIERPVFAVKELIENSIDAGSDSISIHIEESGMKKISIIDNGAGMSKEDLALCYKSHTTSKIFKIEELSHIKTLGFRGEALASIAAISRLTINSKLPADIAGTHLVIKNGVMEKMSSVGMPTGTVVIVEHLFYSLPVRKKFLKSPRSEFRQILDMITGYALSYPQIHFLLTHNQKTILDLPKTNEIAQRIEKLLGKTIVDSVIPLSYDDVYVTVSGFITKPIITSSLPNKIYIFVNSRPVIDKGIYSAIKSAYGSLLSSNSYPICLIQISLPIEMVDVNVHPRKEVIRFADTTMLYNSLKQAISKALASYDLTPELSYTGLFLQDNSGSTDSYAGLVLKDKELPWKLSASVQIDYSQVFIMNNLYIFVVTDTGFIILDQHAVHERILYEQFLQKFIEEKEKKNIIQLAKPVIIELSISESMLLNEYIETFRKTGWELEHFKDSTFVIRGVPILFHDRNYLQLLREILEDMQTESNGKTTDLLTKRMIAFIACRSAIKAGDIITKKQAKELVEQLNKTPNNASCPHGRPTKIAIELDKIHKLFKR